MSGDGPPITAVISATNKGAEVYDLRPADALQAVHTITRERQWSDGKIIPLHKPTGDERITELRLAEYIEDVLKKLPGNQATYAELFHELARVVPFSLADMVHAESRPTEPLWHQQVRNIIVHKRSDGNAIQAGRLDL